MVAPAKTPMRIVLPVCCARTASGHVIVVPTNAKNSLASCASSTWDQTFAAKHNTLLDCLYAL
jgi:hypothetical protein